MGCRKFKGEAFFDDLTGETHLPEELEELVFVVDGQALAIHLDDDNAAKFRAAMAPFVSAARPTSKAKVLATLPKRKRHLTVVPDPPREGSESEPQEESQEGPSPHKGEESQSLSEPEGLSVPDSPAGPLDSAPGSPARPTLALAPPLTERRVEAIPAEWAAHAPSAKDDKPTRVAKARKWATLLGGSANETLTPAVFAKWEEFYQRAAWRNIK